MVLFVRSRYVVVQGGLCCAPILHLCLSSIRPISSADEVSYHWIECANVALQLQRSKQSQESVPTVPIDVSTPHSSSCQTTSSVQIVEMDAPIERASWFEVSDSYHIPWLSMPVTSSDPQFDASENSLEPILSRELRGKTSNRCACVRSAHGM